MWDAGSGKQVLTLGDVEVDKSQGTFGDMSKNLDRDRILPRQPQHQGEAAALDLTAQ